MLTSRVKSGQRAPPSGMQNRFEQFSRQAQTAQFCRDMMIPDCMSISVADEVRR